MEREEVTHDSQTYFRFDFDFNLERACRLHGHARVRGRRRFSLAIRPAEAAPLQPRIGLSISSTLAYTVASKGGALYADANGGALLVDHMRVNILRVYSCLLGLY